MKICYIDKKFHQGSLDIIETANEIIAEYRLQGFDLTLRQLYYQFVARDILPNTDHSYKRLGSIINDARLAGLISWLSITDRTRFIRSNNHWESPEDIVSACASQYRRDHWEGQEWYVEVWIEKDALIGVIQGVCKELDVPHFSCRGYVSQSEMWTAAQRICSTLTEIDKQNAMIIHLGDHDPSGIDMTRDIQDRLSLFCNQRDMLVEVHRIALTMEQVDAYNPPPNPAKLTDARAAGYVAEYGDKSWELDALNPQTLSDLIRVEVESVVDLDILREVVNREKEERAQIRTISDNWDDAVEYFERVENDEEN